MSQDEKLVSYIVRHGTTANNQNNSFRGNIDVPLAPKGLMDAEQLQKYFKDKPLGMAISSDLQRATNTAKIILDPHDIQATETSDLRAWNVGYLSGQFKPDHQTEVQYYQDNPDEIVPRGESLNAFRHRVQPRLKAAFLHGVQDGKPSLVVGHSSIVHETGHMLYGDHTSIKVKPGGVVGVFWNGKKFSARPLVKGVHPTSTEAKHYGM